ncbi:MAG TPA: peptidoglycan editing factor PgeF [Pyrinomonadaceae bacterium]|jgi:YfiH family protein|nr:peptidoglycan editing factor PgeF [Pyrinomonadaceae bacterium]
MPTIINDDDLERSGFYWRELDGVRALICAPLEAAGFANGFSTRMGGTSPMPENALNLAGFNEDSAENILENRRRFLKLFPTESGEWALAGCWQVHGADVRVVSDLAAARPAEDARGDTIYCDAIVSDASGVLAGVKTADCVPLLIGDPNSGAFAAVHAGWRGTLAEVVTKALQQMAVTYKTNARDVCVAIGPAAGACCYEVGTDVIAPFKSRFPDQQLFTETRANHACINLLQANRAQLISAGVEVDNINVAPLCTMCRTDLFFSYRREKATRGKVGRLMSVIGKANM